MSCTGCSNNCVETLSDQCVKYTGVDVSSLEIANGDNMCTVVQKLSEFLQSALDGTGISLSLQGGYCTLISELLEAYESPTLVDIVEVLISAICTIQADIDSLTQAITDLNDEYTVGCLDGVTVASPTHNVLQAVITKLCELDTSVADILVSLETEYVKLADLNDLIASYISSSQSSLMSNRMVPYVAMPFFAPDSYMQGKFDSTGAGIGNWANVYLCNGRNNTPDMRGRVPVCATEGMNGLSYNSAVDPAISGNPTYTVRGTYGLNNTSLTVDQIPVHTHTATGTVTVPAHEHFVAGNGGAEVNLSTSNYIINRADSPNAEQDYTLMGTVTAPTLGKTSTAPAAALSLTITNANTGSTPAKHENIQPVIAAYYIIYLP